LAAWGQAPAAGFQVGAAQHDITPQEPMPMWGYGARHDALSSGVLEPLYANAVVIQAGAKKLAIVGLDLGRAPTETSLQAIRRRIKAEAGIESSFIAASHTHHGPVLELTDAEGRGKGRFDAAIRYYRQLEEAVIGAILEANRRLVPARMAVGSRQLEGFNRNRHTKLEPKPIDRELGVIRFDGLDSKPLAVLVNFTAHPTMIPAETLKFSAEYVGAMRAKVAQELGANVLFMQGASGDQSVHAGERGGYQGFGQALGVEVVKLATELKPAEAERPSLMVREQQFKFESRVNWTDPTIRAGYSLAFFPELVANYMDEFSDGIHPRLTVALLNGEVALVGGSGEFFCNHALRLKERARMKHLLFFGYCNGHHLYFPTIEAVAEGGYGADPAVSPVAVGAGEQMMNTALTWLYQMAGKIK
jgi:hypothetical protein